jgi:hypothetical protein
VATAGQAFMLWESDSVSERVYEARADDLTHVLPENGSAQTVPGGTTMRRRADTSPGEHKMTDGRIQEVLRHVRALATARTVAALSDGELLGRYAVGRDEAAFVELVERHGPMVLSVCRRILGHRQDAEDACQATFLVRKVASIRNHGSAASWLFGVAARTANTGAIIPSGFPDDRQIERVVKRGTRQDLRG